MSCDHSALRLSVRAFYSGTYGWTLQDIGEEPIALFGNCKACHSTIGIQIDLSRGHVVHGEIEAKEEPWSESGKESSEGSPNRGQGSSGPAGAGRSTNTAITTGSGPGVDSTAANTAETMEEHARRVIK